MTSISERLDSELGELVRLYRLSAGLSQVELGDAAGISYQQIQKYESGANKVSVSRLYTVAAALGVTASDLLSELEERLDGSTQVKPSTPVETLHFMATRRGQQIVRAMAACDDLKLLDAFVDLFLAATSQRDLQNGAAASHAGVTS